MKIACISDLHGNLIQYPSKYWDGLADCEVLFICGDILPLKIQHDMSRSKNWLISEFKIWALDLPVEKIYIIAGNHDAWFERNEAAARSIFSEHDKITYLKNNKLEHISIQDGKIYTIFGTPYCHVFGDWPFMRSEEILQENFSHIPQNVDILFCHDAPHGTSDVCLEGWAADGLHKGCPALHDAIVTKKPRYCFHGHLHSSNHEEELLLDTKVYNTSILDESYRIKYQPLMIRI